MTSSLPASRRAWREGRPQPLDRAASFAPQAARDVEAAAEWIADNAGGPDVARRMVDAVLEAADRIASRPGLGRLRPDLLPAPFRFWVVRGFPYLLVYDAGRSPTQVIRVLHMARDLPSLLGDLDI